VLYQISLGLLQIGTILQKGGRGTLRFNIETHGLGRPSVQLHGPAYMERLSNNEELLILGSFSKNLLY